jgi:1-acyl-sn-glycerol-3-phosphate acyltransferase
VHSGAEPLIDRVAAVAASVTGSPVEDPHAPLRLSALGRTELAFALEKAFRVRLDDTSGLRTVADAAATVATHAPTTSVRPSLHPATGRLQGIGRAISEPVVRWYFRLTVSGGERFPRTGPVVLAANHESMWDIPLLVAASPRPIVFMAEEGVFGSQPASWFFTRLGGFPVRRGAGDLRAIRAAFAVIRTHRVLGLYPEGTRRRGTLLRFRPGAAWIALSTGTLLVPAGIIGTGDIFKGRPFPRRTRVRIAFGEPAAVARATDPRERLRQASDLTDWLRSEVGRLIQR